MRIARTIPALLIVMVVVVASPQVEALERILLVRHAEKLDDWPRDRELDALRPLSEIGVRRSDEMAQTLKTAGIAAVYASATTRSVHTGLPLSALTGVEITVERRTTEPEAMDALIAALLERHAGDTAIMIVGHSNTIPELLVRLGATPECYDDLGIVDHGNYLLIEGYEGLWAVDLSKEGCDAIERSEQSGSSGDPLP
jgi:broad specificity phosphatase PhoE